uniref:Protein kinase domain-containing protein n=1 Tax=Rhabditophanes sp. KR3021 TaxID=114890 RepID=A0AC35UC37_9BILA
MSEYVKSAFDYISSQVGPLRPNGSSNNWGFGKTDHELVGSFVEVGGLKLVIRSLLAEGGFALVFTAQDNQSKWYALKRQITVTKDSCDAVLREIRYLRQLTTHKHIINYSNAAQSKHNNNAVEFLLLTELCSGGTVIDLMTKTVNLSTEQIIKIFYSAVSAVAFMHSQNKPLTHRDIKVENLLFDQNGFTKLCDFGSVSDKQYYPTDDWSLKERGIVEDEMTRNTTPMYRAPEIMNLYLNFEIGIQMDIWALGCVLYYLCLNKHPFEDSAKLAIVNANYVLPKHNLNAVFYSLIKDCLKPNPADRPNAELLLEYVTTLADSLGVNLNDPVSGVTSFITQCQLVPTGPKQTVPTTDKIEGNSPSLLSSLKGQGISIFKNLKEKSTAVVQTVQSTYGLKSSDSEERVNTGPHMAKATSTASINERRQPREKTSPVFDLRSSANTSPVVEVVPQVQSEDFFSTLSWEGSTSKKDKKESPKRPPPPKKNTELIEELFETSQKLPAKLNDDIIVNLFDNCSESNLIPRPNVVNDSNILIKDKNNLATNLLEEPNSTLKNNLDDSEHHEQLAGIRVGKEEEADDADEFKFDYEKKPKKVVQSTLVTDSFDLLGIDDEIKASNNATTRDDPFNVFGMTPQTTGNSMRVNYDNNDLLNFDSPMMGRNASAPNLETNNKKMAFDPFEEFLSKGSVPNSSKVSTDSLNKAQPPPKANYNSSYFNMTQPGSTNSANKMDASIFDDLLSSQGFNVTTKNGTKTLGDMRKAEDEKTMDPIEYKIKVWINGKERNIRALLGSLNDVLWEGCAWNQPPMAELLQHAQIRKHYRKACLVVHPDKQMGTANELLAKAIFTELNDAWSSFENK